jgi:hypothetical protein
LCGDLVVVVVVVLLGVDFLFETPMFATEEKTARSDKMKSYISSEKKKETEVSQILECGENYVTVRGCSQILS